MWVCGVCVVEASSPLLTSNHGFVFVVASVDEDVYHCTRAPDVPLCKKKNLAQHFIQIKMFWIFNHCLDFLLTLGDILHLNITRTAVYSYIQTVNLFRLRFFCSDPIFCLAFKMWSIWDYSVNCLWFWTDPHEMSIFTFISKWLQRNLKNVWAGAEEETKEGRERQTLYLGVMRCCGCKFGTRSVWRRRPEW